MDLLGLMTALKRRRVAVALAVLVAIVVSLSTSYKLPSLKPRKLSEGAATGQILVDSNPSTLVAGAGTDQIAALGSRAQVYAQYLSSRDAVARISRQTGIPAQLITARGPFSQGTGIKNYQQQPAESRAKDLVDENKSYRLLYEAQEDVPIITVYATGPSAATALKLAQSSFTVLKQYVDSLQAAGQAAIAARPKIKDPTTGAVIAADDIQVVVRQLGAPEGGTVGGGSSKIIMALAFLAVLGIACFMIAASDRLREQRRRLAAQDSEPMIPDLGRPGPLRRDFSQVDEPLPPRRQRSGSLSG
jgi:precorrin-6x reductase